MHRIPITKLVASVKLGDSKESGIGNSLGYFCTACPMLQSVQERSADVLRVIAKEDGNQLWPGSGDVPLQSVGECLRDRVKGVIQDGHEVDGVAPFNDATENIKKVRDNSSYASHHCPSSQARRATRCPDTRRPPGRVGDGGTTTPLCPAQRAARHLARAVTASRASCQTVAPDPGCRSFVSGGVCRINCESVDVDYAGVRTGGTAALARHALTTTSGSVSCPHGRAEDSGAAPHYPGSTPHRGGLHGGGRTASRWCVFAPGETLPYLCGSNGLYRPVQHGT